MNNLLHLNMALTVELIINTWNKILEFQTKTKSQQHHNYIKMFLGWTQEVKNSRKNDLKTNSVSQNKQKYIWLDEQHWWLSWFSGRVWHQFEFHQLYWTFCTNSNLEKMKTLKKELNGPSFKVRCMWLEKLQAGFKQAEEDCKRPNVDDSNIIQSFSSMAIAIGVGWELRESRHPDLKLALRFLFERAKSETRRVGKGLRTMAELVI